MRHLVRCIQLKQLARMVVVISEKRCGCYTHPYEKNDYNEALEAFLTLLMNEKTLDIQKPNPKR
jgi:ribosome biogenesis GTPase A